MYQNNVSLVEKKFDMHENTLFDFSFSTYQRDIELKQSLILLACKLYQLYNFMLDLLTSLKHFDKSTFIETGTKSVSGGINNLVKMLECIYPKPPARVVVTKCHL